MPLTFDNRISWMDVLTITGGIVLGTSMFFGLQSSVDRNADAIVVVKKDLVRVEANQSAQNEQLSKKLDQQRLEVKADINDLRREVNSKLDQLIQMSADRD